MGVGGSGVGVGTGVGVAVGTATGAVANGGVGRAALPPQAAAESSRRKMRADSAMTAKPCDKILLTQQLGKHGQGLTVAPDVAVDSELGRA